MNILMETWVNPDCTIGRLFFGDFKCVTLELPWVDNFVNVSCIPAGIYSAKKYKSPTKGWVILLEDVYNRTWIQLHAGNFTHQILGCALVGDGLKYLDADSILDVTNSAKTLKKLLSVLPDEFKIEIRRHY